MSLLKPDQGERDRAAHQPGHLGQVRERGPACPTVVGTLGKRQDHQLLRWRNFQRPGPIPCKAAHLRQPARRYRFEVPPPPSAKRLRSSSSFQAWQSRCRSHSGLSRIAVRSRDCSAKPGRAQPAGRRGVRCDDGYLPRCSPESGMSFLCASRAWRPGCNTLRSLAETHWTTARRGYCRVLRLSRRRIPRASHQTKILADDWAPSHLQALAPD